MFENTKVHRCQTVIALTTSVLLSAHRWQHQIVSDVVRLLHYKSVV
jgi:hypothetical protein